MKTTVFAALMALASTLFLVGCGTAASGTAGRPNTQMMQVNTSDANAPTIPSACLAFHRQLVMLHQLVQAAKMEQHELQAQRDAAQTEQAQVQVRLQQCITAITTDTTSSPANCPSLQRRIEALQDEARFIKYELHDVMLDQSEINARKASLATVQVQIAGIQEKLLTCSNTSS